VMNMDEETRVLRDYLAFTVPHVTVLAGAVLGILLLAGIQVRVALGVFAIIYGLMLAVLVLIIRPHVSRRGLYLLSMGLALGLMVVGVLVLAIGE